MEYCSHCGGTFHPFCCRFQSSGERLCSGCQVEKSRLRTTSFDSSATTRKGKRIQTATYWEAGEDYGELNAVPIEARSDYSEAEEEEPPPLPPPPRKKPRLLPVRIESASPKKKRVRPDLLSNGHLKPTAGFFFFLEENREKIEKTMKRRVPKFKKMEEIEKNMHVAKEAAIWWSKDTMKARRKIDLEVPNDFDAEVRLWMKENASHIEMAVENGRKKRISKTSSKQAVKKRLKSLDMEAVPLRDGGGNSLLIELLQDLRFHPLPIFSFTDGNGEFDRLDHSKMTIPKFFVQGPFSTSLGDDCIGCTRGWSHFCPVLKRMLPAVEHRAKLQPPSGTLIASRVGLDTKSKDRSFGMLTEPRERTDDVANFIRNVSQMDMKRDISLAGEGIDDGTGIGKAYQCRCGAVTHSMKGCQQCRRKIFIKECARKSPPESERVSLNKISKIDSVMLGRVSVKDTIFLGQKEHDKNIAAMLCHQKWKPSKILSGDRASGTEASESNSDQVVEAKVYEVIDVESEQPPTDENGYHDETTDKSDSGEEDPVKLGHRRSKRSTEHVNDLDSKASDEEAKARLEATAELNRKCRNIAICGVFLAVTRRDPLRLFAHPVPKSIVGYNVRIMKPMDFGTIRKKILMDEYTGFGGFLSDMKVLCTNAISFNAAGTIYSNTAKEMLECLEEVQKRGKDWMESIKISHSTFHRQSRSDKHKGNDPFQSIRSTWPGSVETLEDGDWLREQVEADFVRTRENEGAYYGALAIRRAAMATVTALTPTCRPVVIRGVDEDEQLRKRINREVSKLSNPARLLDESGWRETEVLKYLRAVQNRRIETKNASKSGCARSDGMGIMGNAKLTMIADALKQKRSRYKSKPKEDTERERIAPSRKQFSTAKLVRRSSSLDMENRLDDKESKQTATSVHGSSIHGWGLFADQEFSKGEVVVEYLGEYISNSMADKREKWYQNKRIQDYQFRVGPDLVIDATLQGGPARYINHNCTPNCIANIIDGGPPRECLKRVLIIAQKDILQGDEITYDYQFPLELDLKARIPCGCGSERCRGFMNWDLPEKTPENSGSDKSIRDVRMSNAVAFGRTKK